MLRKNEEPDMFQESSTVKCQSRLVLNEVTSDDAGEYVCFNPDFNQKRRMRLVVLQSESVAESNQGRAEPQKTNQKRIQIKYEADIDAVVGESVVIYCEYTNEPGMKWRKLVEVKI